MLLAVLFHLLPLVLKLPVQVEGINECVNVWGHLHTRALMLTAQIYSYE